MGGYASSDTSNEEEADEEEVERMRVEEVERERVAEEEKRRKRKEAYVLANSAQPQIKKYKPRTRGPLPNVHCIKGSCAGSCECVYKI